MDKKDLSTSVLNTIKEKKLQPKPKWTFLLKNWVWWLFAAASFVVGSITCAVIIFLISSGDFRFISVKGSHSLKALIIFVPYLWIAVFGGFIGLIYYNIKHTKSGYKYKPSTVIIAMLIASIIGGAILNIKKVGQRVEDRVTKKFHHYRDAHPRHGLWLRKEDGFLGGRIIEIIDKEKLHFKVKNKEGEFMVIFLGVKAVEIEEEMEVFMRGHIDSDNENIFIAQIIQAKPDNIIHDKPNSFRQKKNKPPHHKPLRLRQDKSIY